MTKWTVMVYISADDVLANFAIDSLKQLRQAACGRKYCGESAIYSPRQKRSCPSLSVSSRSGHAEDSVNSQECCTALIQEEIKGAKKTTYSER